METNNKSAVTQIKNPKLIIVVSAFAAFLATFNETYLNIAFTPIMQDMVLRGVKGVIFHCPRQYESKLRGQKNCNLKYWQDRWPSLGITIMSSSADAINVCIMGSECSL